MIGKVPPTAAERLAALDFWPSVPAIEPIAGGRTNENFRVRAGGQLYFARVGQDLPHHRISRANELRCLTLASEAGVAPHVLFAGTGLLVTEYFEGRTLVQGDPVDDDTLARLGVALRRLWSATAPADLPAFDPVDICQGYVDALPAGTHDTRRRRKIEAILVAVPPRDNRWLIHADLIPENVIVASDRIAIVDWEYAGRGDPVVDVAAVAMNFGLDRRQAALLGDEAGIGDGRRIAAFEKVMALREALWCDTQRHFVGVRGDLDAYTELCWGRIDAMPE